MTMEIRIKETNELETLSIIDPKSGCCWVTDLVAGDTDITYNDDTEEDECCQATYDFWSEWIETYQIADDRWYRLLESADSDSWEEMQAEFDDAFNCDLEYHPAILQSMCEKWEAKVQS